MSAVHSRRFRNSRDCSPASSRSAMAATSGGASQRPRSGRVCRRSSAYFQQLHNPCLQEARDAGSAGRHHLAGITSFPARVWPSQARSSSFSAWRGGHVTGVIDNLVFLLIGLLMLLIDDDQPKIDDGRNGAERAPT